jgi:hypothetical protein
MALVPKAINYHLECEQRQGTGHITVSTEGATIELRWADPDIALFLVERFAEILADSAEAFRRGEVEPKKPDDWSTEELF